MTVVDERTGRSEDTHFLENSTSGNNSELSKPDIPDGGYGWVVVAATFVIYAIAEGISFAFGLLFIEFLHEFKGTKSATSWIGSLFVALPLVSGPIGSALVSRYGCQKMTIIGSAFTAAGFALSSQANSLGLVYLTFGIVGGLARSVCYITVVVSVTLWFEKRRSVALGISASGTGFGTIIFAPFTEYLLFEFGWRGTVLILGGFLANMCVCGALMIDPKWAVKQQLRKKRRSVEQTEPIELTELRKNDESKAGVLLFEHEKSIGSAEQSLKEVLLGWIGDRWVVSKAFAISLILCGVSIWGMIFFTSNYISIVGCAASFGFFFSSCFSLTPSLLAELVSFDDFTMGYGLILLCEGSGHLIGPPLAGYISDVSKSWNQSFYQAGLWIVIAGVLIGIIPFTKNKRIFGNR